MAKKKRTNNVATIVIILVVVAALLIASKNMDKFKMKAQINQTSRAWQAEYSAAIVDLEGDYLGPTEFIDSEDPMIVMTAANIAAASNSLDEAVQKTLDYVYLTVEYNAHESDERCFKATSSEVLKSKTGQCDTQTMSVEGLLRAQGIATRRVGGCVWKDASAKCAAKFALQSVFSIAGLDVREPQFEPISEEDIISGKISRGGYLHLWGEYYDPARGWVGFESTAGKLTENNCYTYNVELYPTNIVDTCISQDREYAQWCRVTN